MATNFPTSLDSPTNPISSNTLNSPSHSAQHSFENDAIVALETKVGVTGSAVNTTVDYKLSGVAAGDKAASKTGTETLTNKTLGTGAAVTLGSDATGDMYTRGSGGALQRVAIGSAGQVLGVSAGLPAYVPNPAASNGSTSVAGIYQEATTAQINSGTATGSTGADLVMNPAQFAASQYGGSPLSSTEFFGDASDGTVVFDGSTTILGLVPSGSAYTLTRDIYCNNITVNTGVSIITAGFRIFAQGTTTLTGTGTIKNNGVNGGNASTSTGGTGGTIPSSVTTSVGTAGGAGGAGAIPNGSINGTNGSNSTATTYSISTAGGIGGTGGAGTNTPGSAGTAGGATASGTNGIRDSFTALSQVVAGNIIKLGTGGGGGGGGASTNNVGNTGGGGGGGGAAGGLVFLASKALAGTGNLTATGGVGGNGANAVLSSGGAGGGGAGGGGAGGVVILISKTAANPYTVTVTGGAAGSAGTGVGTGGTGGAAAAGSAGNSFFIVI